MKRSPIRHLPNAVLMVLLTGTVAAVSQQPGAQEPPVPGGGDVTVVLEGRLRSQFRLAIPEFKGMATLPSELRSAADEADQTLRSDLEDSKIFRLQGPEELSVLALTGDLTRDFELYRSLQNELVLDVDLRPEGDKLVIEGRLYHLETGDSILGKRYRGTPEVARRMAHTFADEIILALSGRPGVALTQITFNSDRSGFKEIYLMDYDGANQRPVTAHKSISLSPDWSRAGDTIAYVSYFSGAPGVYLVDLATGRKQPVVTEGSLNISPSFSPDGQRIVFGRSMGSGNTEIFAANRDGTGLRQLTHSSGIDTNPSWSPSGREIAFTSSRAGNPNIYVMDAEGANLRRLTFEGDYNDGAAWSPDGTRIAYASRRSGRFDIALTDVVTLESRLLTSGPGSNETPSFSPDGRQIVFASKRGNSATTTQIYKIELDGSGIRQLTSDGNNFSPSWSGFSE
jgi:TolB protein